MSKFMYRPPEGDAASTEMGKIVFPANTPVEVPDKVGDHYDWPERFEVDGMMRTRTVRRFVPLAELLRNNPHFTEVVDEKSSSKNIPKGTKIAEGWEIDKNSPLEVIGKN